MFAEWFVFLLGLILCVVLAPFLLGPIVVFFMLRFRMPPNVVMIDPRKHALPDDARAYLDKAYRELVADGFELRGTVFLPDLAPNAKTLFALYTNPATSDMAMSAIIVAQSGVGGELKTSYVEFLRRYDDEIVVQTNNSRELSAFKPLPGEHTTKFWEVQDIRELYVLHLGLVERFRRRGQPLNRLDNAYGGDVVRFVSKQVLEETFRDQVGTGYLAEGAQGFRPTTKGACIMAWQELWPAKGIRRRREKRRAEEALAGL